MRSPLVRTASAPPSILVWETEALYHH
ncbi:hypothetical protein NC651_009532 [Populus alba x Populus x berolinensis]|nr:hypothetical protein NC651_009532 [Populus alba x Populus x berolinensis]